MATLSSPHLWKPLPLKPIDPDEAIRWGCSGKGWHCCVDFTIPVRPYDLVRVRHAVHQPSEWLINEKYVTFSWDGGTFVGQLAQVPYERNRNACVFYEEVTNVGARAIRDADPKRFAGLPEQLRKAADSTAAGEWRVAGLCNAHQNRPEACRGFPFQRDPARENREDASPTIQVFRCGTCALSTLTTPREVMADNQLEPYWRADDAFLEVIRYFHSRGLANFVSPEYALLPVNDITRTGLWVSMYTPDTNPTVAAAFPEQWLSDFDPEGDEAIYRMLLDQALDRVDGAVAASGVDPLTLGRGHATLRPRPDFDQLLDPTRELFVPKVSALKI